MYWCFISLSCYTPVLTHQDYQVPVLSSVLPNHSFLLQQSSAVSVCTLLEKDRSSTIGTSSCQTLTVILFFSRPCHCHRELNSDPLQSSTPHLPRQEKVMFQDPLKAPLATVHSGGITSAHSISQARDRYVSCYYLYLNVAACTVSTYSCPTIGIAVHIGMWSFYSHCFLFQTA